MIGGVVAQANHFQPADKVDGKHQRRGRYAGDIGLHERHDNGGQTDRKQIDDRNGRLGSDSRARMPAPNPNAMPIAISEQMASLSMRLRPADKPRIRAVIQVPAA